MVKLNLAALLSDKHAYTKPESDQTTRSSFILGYTQADSQRILVLLKFIL